MPSRSLIGSELFTHWVLVNWNLLSRNFRSPLSQSIIWLELSNFHRTSYEWTSRERAICWNGLLFSTEILRNFVFNWFKNFKLLKRMTKTCQNLKIIVRSLDNTQKNDILSKAFRKAYIVAPYFSLKSQNTLLSYRPK